MLYINEVTLLGNLGKDLEVRQTQSGVSVGNTSIATTRSWKDGDEWKEKTQWTDIVLWGKLAELNADRFKKGARVYVRGELETQEWTDKNDQKRYSTVVKVAFARVDRPAKGEELTEAPAAATASAPAAAGPSQDDIPF